MCDLPETRSSGVKIDMQKRTNSKWLLTVLLCQSTKTVEPSYGKDSQPKFLQEVQEKSKKKGEHKTKFMCKILLGEAKVTKIVGMV